MGVAAFILAQAAAAQLTIGVQAPSTAAACEAIEIVVTTSAPTHIAPLLTAPSFAPFQVLRRSVRPSVTVAPTGDPSIRVEHRFVLTAERTGTFTIPPFVAQWNGDVKRSRSIRIAVHGGARTPGVVARARIDPSDEVTFQAMATPDTVFVGQQVHYEVAVFLNEAMRSRLRRSPTFYPPDMPAMLAYDLPPDRGQPPRRQAGGQCYEALVYQRAIFPLQPGRTVIPPAQLVYSVPLGPGLFAREESRELRTDSVVVVAVAPPAAGRPVGDIGAVGDLNVGARVDTTGGRVGDPVTLTVRVEGEANVKLLPRPRLRLDWGSLVPDAERVEIDSAGRRVRGAKEFDWLILPRVAGQVVVPPVEYPHFDPYARAYEVARTQPITLEIEPGLLALADTAAVPRLAIRQAYRGPLGAPVHTHPGFWLLALAAPLPALVRTVRARRSATSPGVAAADLLRSLARDNADARQVRRAFVAAVSERLHVPAGTFTTPGALERALRRSGVTRERAAEAERFLRMLDAVAYGSGASVGLVAGEAARTAVRLHDAIDAEALARWELGPGATLALFVVVAATAATAVLADPAGDAAAFSRASAAYAAGAPAVAAAEFERLALRQPRAPDAWANYGTASWEAADTAAAVTGWQRALRLEPGAEDMRRRLAALRVEAVGAPGHVPPVGVPPLAVGALALWLLACAIAARPPRPGSPLRAMGIAAAAAALTLAGFGVVADERLAAEDGVVLRRATALASSPAIGARREARVETGEVGRAGPREGGWTHVRFDPERAGWVPSAELLSIARARVGAD